MYETIFALVDETGKVYGTNKNPTWLKDVLYKSGLKEAWVIPYGSKIKENSFKVTNETPNSLWNSFMQNFYLYN